MGFVNPLSGLAIVSAHTLLNITVRNLTLIVLSDTQATHQ